MIPKLQSPCFSGHSPQPNHSFDDRVGLGDGDSVEGLVRGGFEGRRERCEGLRKGEAKLQFSEMKELVRMRRTGEDTRSKGCEKVTGFGFLSSLCLGCCRRPSLTSQ
ncbi:hypothetical protein RIF29_00667 [Crotalaria pallida]|uniref:Uncharacterized protein n=1 Tax=Crotalaria pallida TaxID=3830 RepID=A0AAN9IXR3_CROPI